MDRWHSSMNRTSKNSTGMAAVVRHRDRLPDEARAAVEQRPLLQRRVEVRLALEHRVEPLDGRDDHPGDRVDVVRGQVLDVVELGELAAVVGARRTAGTP